MICLTEIAGYMTEEATWELLDFLSKKEGNGVLQRMSPRDVGIMNDEFCLLDKEKQASRVDEADYVWHIGALAFYALMGVQIFGGQGAEKQTGEMEVPYVGSSHCSSSLSQLIHQCLLFESSQRPKLAEIREYVLKNKCIKCSPKKKMVTSKGKIYRDSLVSFWPEEMTVVFVWFLMLLFPNTALAQTEVPTEMATIINRCKQLRNSSNINKVSREFLYDMSWTLMDEIDIDRKAECTVKDQVSMFGLNDMGYRIAKRQGGVTNMGGRFRNGQDERYQYSFIEITIKKGMSVNYEITGRQGLQQFAVLPYTNTASFTVSVKKSGMPFGKSMMKDGVCYVQLNWKVAKSDKFLLSIHNGTGKNMAFVIVNHNPGK